MRGGERGGGRSIEVLGRVSLHGNRLRLGEGANTFYFCDLFALAYVGSKLSSFSDVYVALGDKYVPAAYAVSLSPLFANPSLSYDDVPECAPLGVPLLLVCELAFLMRGEGSIF